MIILIYLNGETTKLAGGRNHPRYPRSEKARQILDEVLPGIFQQAGGFF
jgi:hypothetical protein